MKLIIFYLFCIASISSTSSKWKIFHDIKDDLSKINKNNESKLSLLIKNGIELWNDFKLKHNKQLDNKFEETEHILIFLQSLKYIKKHNEHYNEGHVSFKLGLTSIADLSYDEYKQLNGYKSILRDNSTTKKNTLCFMPPLNVQIPDAVDWREKNFVTPVKNQGMCGSCWAFSSTGALEGQHMRKTNELVSLSEQNLIDCSAKYGNHGCNGGLMDLAYQYIKDNKGIDTEESYPYTGKQHKCTFKPSDVGADDIGYVDIPSEDEEQLRIAVATIGPISVAIDAKHASFQLYKSGVYYEKKCSSTDLDHGVLIVGYGTDSRYGDYWIVKNSWGEEWGENGYIRMARNRENHCGIATQASYPLV